MTDQAINIDDLESLLNADGWTHTQHHEEIEREPRINLDGDDIPAAWGIAWVKSKRDGLTITYQETYNYDLHEPDSLTTSTEGQDFVWALEGARLIDEDGDNVIAENIGDYAPDAFSTIDYDDLLTISETEDIDMSDDKMDTIELQRDNAPDVRFTGEQIASASSREHDGPRNTRWTELTLYRTASGKLVASEIGRTQWHGEHDRHSVHIADSESALIESLGYGWLAKDLYDEAGIQNATEI